MTIEQKGLDATLVPDTTVDAGTMFGIDAE